MDIGMLWFDNDKQSDLTIKVNKAVTHYHTKYGQKPNLCFVNPCMIANNGMNIPESKKYPKTANEIEIRESKTLLPNHFWIGIKSIES
jgi:hypothetical protein